jgi:type I restriction enzyme M protein
MVQLKKNCLLLSCTKNGEPTPEVLFIEACYNFLKEGGKMAIVLPDGILGNPNTLPVREWILDKFKILASIDLAVEAFLPQVGVQASLLFLQKKTELERQVAQDGDEDYDVFMAIAEKLGKDRRGNPIYLRDEDGAELLFETETQYLIRRKDNDKPILKSRKEKLKQLDDDLPKISDAYFKFKSEQESKNLYSHKITNQTLWMTFY